jgi:hypothetical protein
VPLCPLLSSTVSPLSVYTSNNTACWFCVTMSNAVFYSLFSVCHYLTEYRLLVLCHYVHCCLLLSVHCLSISHILASVCSVTLCPFLSSTLCPQSISTSQCPVCWFCFIMFTAVFYNLSTVCQYLTLYRLTVLCHYVHSCLLQSVHSLSAPKYVPSVVQCHYVPSCFLQSVHCLSEPHTIPSVG